MIKKKIRKNFKNLILFSAILVVGFLAINLKTSFADVGHVYNLTWGGSSYDGFDANRVIKKTDEGTYVPGTIDFSSRESGNGPVLTVTYQPQ